MVEPKVQKIGLADKLSLFSDTWSPKIIANIDDYDIRVVKLEGEFVWHSHADADEMFLVVEGKLRMRFRDGDQVLGPGELIIVPKGVEHMPVAEPTAQVVLIEKSEVINTGDAGGDRTVEVMEHL